MNFVSDNRNSLYIMALASCVVGGATAIVSAVNTARKQHYEEQPVIYRDIPRRKIVYRRLPQETEQIIDDRVLVESPINKQPLPVLRGHDPIVIQDSTQYYIPSSNNGIEFATEKRCRKIIEEYFRAPFPKKSNFCRNPLTSAPLELDGYSEPLKVAFEYQGEQHYDEDHKFWKTKKEYKDQIFRDRVKRVACKRRGVRLIVIPYTAKKGKGGLEKVLGDYLQQNFPDSLRGGALPGALFTL